MPPRFLTFGDGYQLFLFLHTQAPYRKLHVKLILIFIVLKPKAAFKIFNKLGKHSHKLLCKKAKAKRFLFMHTINYIQLLFLSLSRYSQDRYLLFLSHKYLISFFSIFYLFINKSSFWSRDASFCSFTVFSS